MTNKELRKSALRLVLCIVSCILILISNIGLISYNVFFMWTLCIGLLLLQILAVLNGLMLHKRPNWLHHFIRLIFSIFIIIFYNKIA